MSATQTRQDASVRHFNLSSVSPGKVVKITDGKGHVWYLNRIAGSPSLGRRVRGISITSASRDLTHKVRERNPNTVAVDQILAIGEDAHIEPEGRIPKIAQIDFEDTTLR